MRRLLLGLAAMVVAAGCGARDLPAPSVARSPAPSTTAAPTAAPSAAPSAAPTAAPTAALLARDAVRGRLAFSSETRDGREDVFLLDLGVDPLGSRQLTDGTARAFDPDLSPDGASVVYRVNPDPSSDAADLWLLGTDASVPRNLTSDPSLHNWSPAWSPDGSRIAFASTREGGTLRVWTMAPDGSDVRRVTDGHGEYPDWSPDGRQIVFAAPTTSSGGSYDLWIVPTDGPGTPTRLTATPETEFAPAWSPDGHSIAWQRDAGERWELWVGRADGSAARRVSPSGEDGVWPAWSPDGTLGWSGTAGLSFLDLASGARRSLRPDRRGTDFLDWGR